MSLTGALHAASDAAFDSGQLRTVLKQYVKGQAGQQAAALLGNPVYAAVAQKVAGAVIDKAPEIIQKGLHKLSGCSHSLGAGQHPAQPSHKAPSSQQNAIRDAVNAWIQQADTNRDGAVSQLELEKGLDTLTAGLPGQSGDAIKQLLAKQYDRLAKADGQPGLSAADIHQSLGPLGQLLLAEPSNKTV